MGRVGLSPRPRGQVGTGWTPVREEVLTPFLSNLERKAVVHADRKGGCFHGRSRWVLEGGFGENNWKEKMKCCFSTETDSICPKVSRKSERKHNNPPTYISK